MEIITIESPAFSKLLANLEKLTRELHTQNQGCKPSKEQTLPKGKLTMNDQWLDKEEVCELLKVSKRTLQNYRDNF
ncbi:MAG: helix-turn-helix domain-containing protein, partial [Bacteroidales bacterium]|nr:helix-turn-helix domain-containing protein [Bacteroidales bacterium]